MAAARRPVVCFSIAVVAACAESSIVPPTAPSPLDPNKVGELGLDCPVGRRVQSPDGNPIPLDYPPPVVRGGQGPVTVACDPASGAAFPVGATRVSCTAGDALGQGAACSFVLRVLPPPMLGVTRILAFGNSLTAGILSGGSVSVGRSYPAKLQQRLRSAYRAQSIRVFNEGVPGERAVEASGRLASVLARHRPEVVILMEGTNDLADSSIESANALYAVDQMVGMVQAAGAAPVLATLPPIRSSVRGVHAAGVSDFNDGVRAVGAGRGAAVIDIYGEVAGGRCVPAGGSPFPCIGPDGLHPTAEGYGLMADAFFNHLVGRYDQRVTAPGAGLTSVVEAEGGSLGVD